MLGWLLDPFSGALMQRALAEVLVVAVACGPLGVWVLLYRQSYAAESISHAMLPGLVVAALAGAPLLLGAAGGVLLAAAAIALAGRDERLGGDVGVAVAISALFGLGALLALSPDVPARLGELLFGDLLGVTGGDVGEAAALAAGVVAVLALAHRRLALSAFDRAAAPSLGVRPARWELVLLALLAVSTVAAVRGLGNLLVVALILAPAAAALNLARRLTAALVLSALLAALAGVLGLLASYHFNVAAGAAVALAAVGLFLVSLVSVTPLRRAARRRAPAGPPTRAPAPS
jgi:ABC-type Mn2+/Zn2+ transport system permease subunit